MLLMFIELCTSLLCSTKFVGNAVGGHFFPETKVKKVQVRRESIVCFGDQGNPLNQLLRHFPVFFSFSKYWGYPVLCLPPRVFTCVGMCGGRETSSFHEHLFSLSPLIDIVDSPLSRAFNPN